MQTARTVLELKIKERRQTLQEFAEFAETFAREHDEPGTLSVRHLQRLTAGRGRDGQPLGQLRPATARLLERIFGLGIDELLVPPGQMTTHVEVAAERRAEATPVPQSAFGQVEIGWLGRRETSTPAVQTPETRVDMAMSFAWLDDHAGWSPETTRRKVMSRLGQLSTDDLLDRHARRGKVHRSQIANALMAYYADDVQRQGHAPYRVHCGHLTIQTSVLTRPSWLDLACPLGQGNDRLTLSSEPGSRLAPDDTGIGHAVHRLAEAAALGVRVANVPLYRLLGINVEDGTITGSVGVAPFVEYAVTMDLLEKELVDSVGDASTDRLGDLPLRDRYLPNIASVLDLSGRLCAGGVLALCAIARPADPYRGERDYALLIQQRSGHVLNAARRLAVIPKGFHQPMTDIQADAQLGTTLLREMEEELFGRSEVDSTIGAPRAAAPLHPGRLSEPMKWLMADSGRVRMECTGFGLNLVSGNFEFACLVVIDDDEFWTRYGGQVEANWEASGLRLYSSLDDHLVAELVADECWSDEGLFALSQGIRRLRELGGDGVNLPFVTWS
ncbi:transcriptional regulator [Saccharopolyspora sp. ASAGF58]|uniref:transcriptional regulator n=1 Tax=Saccharopolyspora sp. ASAGF58 TaxID=2719023 RepID=UPI001B31716A|nr:transcriptional regulator [Saccharopolyspora sp. ASAGF58]